MHNNKSKKSRSPSSDHKITSYRHRDSLPKNRRDSSSPEINRNSSSKSSSRDSFKKKKKTGETKKRVYYSRSKNSSSRSRKKSFSRSSSRKRNFSRDKERPEGEKKLFPIDFFIEKTILDHFKKNDFKIFQEIKTNFQIETCDFNNELKIPELDGKVVRIFDKDMSKKCDAFYKILQEISNFNIEFKKLKSSSFSVILLVPEGMVSLLIGSKGKQISSIMKTSRTEIVVNQPIHKMRHRTVKVEGKSNYIRKAAELIYTILEEKSPHVTEIEKVPESVPLSQTQITAKFVFPTSVVGYLIGKNGGFTKFVCEDCNVNIKFIDNPDIKCIKRNESVCIVSGKLEKVQTALVLMFRRVNEYYEQYKKQMNDYSVKLLIPNTYVTKLIGAKGCMIRELAAKSQGAQIKILSDKQSEKEFQECLINIAGSLANKQDACCLILEQLEIFKNGGPILLSGKSINENLAGQYRNCIQLRDSSFAEGHSQSPSVERKKKKTDHKRRSRSKDNDHYQGSNAFKKKRRYSYSESSKSRSKSRSRSRSKSKSKEIKKDDKLKSSGSHSLDRKNNDNIYKKKMEIETRISDKEERKPEKLEKKDFEKPQPVKEPIKEEKLQEFSLFLSNKNLTEEENNFIIKIESKTKTKITLENITVINENSEKALHYVLKIKGNKEGALMAFKAVSEELIK